MPGSCILTSRQTWQMASKAEAVRSAVNIQERSPLAADVPESRLWKCGAVEQRHLHAQRIKDEGVTFLVNFSLRTPWILWN
jgi:hypothetical protein